MLHCSESYQIFWISCLPLVKEKKPNYILEKHVACSHSSQGSDSVSSSSMGQIFTDLFVLHPCQLAHCLTG